MLPAAIQKNPSSALAYARLADTYVLQVLITGANAIEHWSKAQRAIDRALKLNPMLAEPHSAAAMIDFFIAWNWTAAEQSFARALELNPNCTTARLYYAHLLSNSSRHDEAVAEIKRAREIDPLSPVMHVREPVSCGCRASRRSSGGREARARHRSGLLSRPQPSWTSP